MAKKKYVNKKDKLWGSKQHTRKFITANASLHDWYLYTLSWPYFGKTVTWNLGNVVSHGKRKTLL